MVDQVDGLLRVTVRFFAAARAAAGVDEETVSVPGPATVGAVLKAIVERHASPLADVLPRCSYLLTETAVHGAETPVSHGDILDVLPPFAGG